MMNERELYDWTPIPSGDAQHAASTMAFSPYDQSLLGEFARLLLLLIAAPLLLWFAYSSITIPSSFLPTFATAVLVTSLLYARGPKIIRIAGLALMSINILTIAVNPEYIFGEEVSDSTQLPTAILFLCLALAFAFETSGLILDCSERTKNKLVAWSVIGAPALIYVLIIPLVQMCWLSFAGSERELALRDPDWTFLNETIFRACEFSMFGIFTYVGACMGSFLNVVAYSVPRGESIGLRDSRCQRCDTKLSRIDNLPIFSYLNLGARCRTCCAPIPARYLIVELVVAFIFGSLFLYELITGCNNVPSMRIFHQGILWVILYPKWPAIAIYVYHAVLMSSVLVVAIIEWDRQPLRPVFSGVLASTFLFPALVYWPVLPVAATEHLPFALNLSPFIHQLLKIFTGGLVAVTIGYGMSALNRQWNTSTFRFALALAGIALGWQAVIQIMVLYVFAWMLISCTEKLRFALASPPPTALLFTVILIHHPFWKTMANWWN